jgi:hypothetical protein
MWGHITTAWRGLQIYRIAANIPKKQSRTADKGWPPAWWLGEGLGLLIIKKACFEMLCRALVNTVMNLRVSKKAEMCDY